LDKKKKDEYHKKLDIYYKKYKESVMDFLYSHYSDDALSSLIKMWIESSLITITDSKKLWPPQRSRSTNRLLKSFETKAFSVIKRIPNEVLPVAPDVVPPELPKQTTYEEVPIGILSKYAAMDAVITYKILKKQKEGIKKDWDRIKEIERENQIKNPNFVIPTKPLTFALSKIIMPMSAIISEMEYYGVKIDRSRTMEYITKLSDTISDLRQSMLQEVGHAFNVDSPRDLQTILYSELKYDIPSYTEKGSPCTDATTLKALAEAKDSTFLNQLLIYRKLVKCKTTYLENWLKMSEMDGNIHTSFNLHGTATGRLSSSSPNLQNVPFYLKEADLNLKDIFIPDSEDFDLYDLDISNAEMRVLCAYSKDEALCDAFINGKDLHCLTGAGISNFSYEQLKERKEDKSTEEYRIRQVAKKVNFGTVYGISAKALSRQLWEEMRINYSEEETEKFLNLYFRRYPRVKQYIDSTMAFTQRYGFTHTFMGRRRRFGISQYRSKLNINLNRILRQSINTRIQSTSSDLVLTNIINLHTWAKKLGGRCLLTVHDSIVFQLPKEVRNRNIKEELDQIIKYKTNNEFTWLPVPWEYDVGRGPSYGHAKEPVT
jgi:DNA polymerase-1